MGSHAFVLARAIGDAFVHGDVPEPVVTELLKEGLMLSSLWLLALTVGLLIVASAFSQAAETALTAASDARMRQLANKGNKRAKIVEKLRADREGLIGSILIGNNAVNVLGQRLPPALPLPYLARAAGLGNYWYDCVAGGVRRGDAKNLCLYLC